MIASTNKRLLPDMVLLSLALRWLLVSIARVPAVAVRVLGRGSG